MPHNQQSQNNNVMAPTAIIALILQGLEALIAAAPGIAEIVQKAHDLIDTLFTNNLITKETQDALHQTIDARAALAAQGIYPPWWKVQDDPQPIPTPIPVTDTNVPTIPDA